MIDFKNVKKIYNTDYVALDDITFHVEKGEFASIVGMSGAGKSTLMRLFTKEVSPTSGDIVIDGENLNDIKNNEIPFFRRKFGTIFQDFKLLDYRTSFENVGFAMEVSDSSDEEILKDVPKILSIVGLKDKASYFPDQLSGGERQRLAIARAMIHRPKILLADEPTGNLDLVNSYDVVKLLLKINEFGTTVLLATHDTNVVNRIGKRVITMEKGKITRDQKSGKYII